MKTLLATLAIVVASQGHALSCMRLTPESMFTWANQSDASFVPVYGKFNVKVPVRPKGDPLRPKGYEVTGTFDGRFVTKTGLTQPTSLSVVFNVTCAASWCGHPPSNEVRLAVLEKRGSEYVYNAHACPSTSLQDPDKTALRAFRKCWRGGACSPQNK